MALANSLPLIKNNALMFTLCRFRCSRLVLVTIWRFGCLPSFSRWETTNNKQLVLLEIHWQHPHARQSFDSFLIRVVPGQTCVINWVESAPRLRRCENATCVHIVPFHAEDSHAEMQIQPVDVIEEGEYHNTCITHHL